MNTEQLKTKEQILDKAVYGNLNYVPIHKIKTLILEAMSDFASQESNKAVSEFKEKLRSEVTKRIDDHHSIGSMEVLTEKEIFDLIDKL